MKDGQMDNNTTTIKVLKIKATHLAQTCPVCNGFGTLRHGSKMCQGCAGKGYILIPAEEIKEVGR